MNWTQPRKSYKSSEQTFSGSKKLIESTCLNTAIFDKQYLSFNSKNNTSHNKLPLEGVVSRSKSPQQSKYKGASSSSNKKGHIMPNKNIKLITPQVKDRRKYRQKDNNKIPFPSQPQKTLSQQSQSQFQQQQSSPNHHSPGNHSSYLQQKNESNLHISSPSLPPNNSCAYHFNQKEHVCLTCRKSICLRCAITYCQNHLVKCEQQTIPILLKDLHEIHIKERLEEIEVKLSQSYQRQDYIRGKAHKIAEKVQRHFESLIEIIHRKKDQIVEYFDEQARKTCESYEQYDIMLKSRYCRVKEIAQQSVQTLNMQHQQDWLFHGSHDNPGSEGIEKRSKLTIEKVDEYVREIREQDQQLGKYEKSIQKFIGGTESLKTDKIWSEELLEGVMYEVQNIKFKMQIKDRRPRKSHNPNTNKKKKRAVTQNSDNCKQKQTQKINMFKFNGQNEMKEQFERQTGKQRLNFTEKQPLFGNANSSGDQKQQNTSKNYQSGRKNLENTANQTEKVERYQRT